MSISPLLVERIRKAFPESIRSRFVSALQEAYDTACDKWTPESGSIPQTFGMDVWAAATFQLRRVTEDTELEIEVEYHLNRTTLRKDGLFLSFYRVGHSADEDIRTCFPNNRHAAPRLARNNLQLDIFLDGDPHPDAPVDLMLAHLGNTGRGLEAVYLCVPTAAEGDQLTEWGHIELLWRRDGLAAGGTPAGAPQPPAPEAPIGEPQIRLKTDRATGQE
jgi:hypothetical protein